MILCGHGEMTGQSFSSRKYCKIIQSGVLVMVMDLISKKEYIMLC